MARLLLVRHGETELNSSERYWGHTDVALSAVGLKQAEQLRHRLATEKISTIYSSDLRRALLTAETIASPHRPEFITCPELKEINFGQLEGLTFDEVSEFYPEVMQLWRERNPKLRYPGGESLDEFNERVTSFLSRLEKHGDEETVLILAHAGVLRTLICQLLDVEPWHRWQLCLDLASLTIIETYPQGTILSLLNDTCHLAERS